MMKTGEGIKGGGAYGKVGKLKAGRGKKVRKKNGNTAWT